MQTANAIHWPAAIGTHDLLLFLVSFGEQAIAVEGMAIS